MGVPTPSCTPNCPAHPAPPIAPGLPTQLHLFYRPLSSSCTDCRMTGHSWGLGLGLGWRKGAQVLPADGDGGHPPPPAQPALPIAPAGRWAHSLIGEKNVPEARCLSWLRGSLGWEGVGTPQEQWEEC